MPDVRWLGFMTALVSSLMGFLSQLAGEDMLGAPGAGLRGLRSLCGYQHPLPGQPLVSGHPQNPRQRVASFRAVTLGADEPAIKQRPSCLLHDVG